MIRACKYMLFLKNLAERMEGSVNVLLIEQVPELRVYYKTVSISGRCASHR